LGWQLGLLEATSDTVITPQEVTGIVTDTINSAIQAIVVVGMMSMVVRGFYGMLGPKKYAKQEEEVLEIVERVW